MILLPGKKLYWYLQHQERYNHNKLQDLNFNLYNIRLSYHYWKTKASFFTVAINFTENLIKFSTNSLAFDKLCKAIYSTLLIKDFQDSYVYYIHCKTCESTFADVTSL